MSEFNFSCPACGQTIVGDSSQAGTEVACPGCHAPVTVPGEAAGTAGVSAPTDAPPPWTGYNGTPVAQRTSGLAVASLICSLSSVITCVGWLPGIICGHLAKSRLRRDSTLQGRGLATAGLVIGYLALILEVGTVAARIGSFTTALKQGFNEAQQNLATNPVLVVASPPVTVSNPVAPAETAAPAPSLVLSNPPVASVPTAWTSDLSRVPFPVHPAGGTLHGVDFTTHSSLFRNGDLRIRAADGMSVDIYRLGDSIENRNLEIRPGDDGAHNPRVKMTWTDKGVTESATYNRGYGLKLQFGPMVNRKVSGKIYLCLPDDAKSYVAGTLEVRIPKPR